MIVTLTLNPAVDKTIFVSKMTLGDINRVHDSHFDPAGKGINVSRMAHRLDWPTIALGFLAGNIGDLAQKSLADEEVQSQFLRVTGETRLNVTIVDRAAGSSTSFYDEGPRVSPEELLKLDRQLSMWLRTCRALVMAGSLPPGLPADTYARYVRMAREAGVMTILDAHDEPMRLGIEASPDLIKPNVSELEGILGRALPDQDAIVAAARELLGRGVKTVVISMGAGGTICAQGIRIWRAIPPTVERRSTVGSGDSMVAGLAIAMARGQDIVEGLRLGTAAGAATAMTPATDLGSLAEVQELLPKVQIDELA